MTDSKIEEAKAILEADKKERAEKCQAEINAILEKYGMILQPQILLTSK